MRLLARGLMLGLGLLLLGTLAFAGLVLKVDQGPLDVSFAAPDVVRSINSRLSHGFSVSIKSLVLDRGSGGLHLTAEGFDVQGPTGHLLSGVGAVLSLDPWSMLRGQLVPKSVTLSGLALVLTFDAKGAIALSNGTRQVPAPPLAVSNGSAAPAQPPPTPTDAVKLVSQSLDMLLAADSPLAALHNVRIQQSSILIRDLGRGRDTRLDHVDVAVARQAGGLTLDLAASNGRAPWHAHLRVNTSATDASRLVQLTIDHWSFAGLRHLAQYSSAGALAEISGTLTGQARISKAGALMALSADAEGGPGLFMADSPDFEPLLFDGFSLKAHYDPSQRVVLVDQARLQAGKSALLVSGKITLPAANATSLGFDFSTQPGTQLGPERPGDKTLLISNGRFVGSFDQATKLLRFDQMALGGAAVHVSATASAALGASPHVVAQALISAMQARDVVRLWPSSLAAPVRAWFRQRLTAGTVASINVKVDMDAKALADVGAQQAVPENALQVTGQVSGIGLRILDGFPPVTGINAKGLLTGHTVHVSFGAGQIIVDPGKAMKISSGTFDVHDSSLIPAPARIMAQMSGTLATTTQLLAMDALRPFVQLPLDPKSIAGTISGQLRVDTLLGDHVPPTATKVGVTAKIDNFSATNLIGKAGLTQGSLNFKVSAAGMNATGNGTIFASPAKLVLTQPPHGEGQGKLNFTLSDAARKKLDFAIPGVSGPIGVALVAPLGAVPVQAKGQKQKASVPQQAQVTLDLGATTLDEPFPGLHKAPGRPARATFLAVVQPHATVLKNLIFEGGGVSFAGTATLGADGHPQSAQLSQVKLSALDQMRADITFGTKSTKVVAKGAAFDMRSVWSSLTGQDNLAPRATTHHPTAKPANVEVSLTATRVTGYNDVVAHNGHFLLERLDGHIRAFDMSGQLGSGSLHGELDASGMIHLTSSDAGATLDFLNLYSHMQGGTLELSAHYAGSDASGNATIHKFSLINEPRLHQIAAADNPHQNLHALASSRVQFQKLQAQFSSKAGAITLENADIFGPDIGISMRGILNFPQNRLDVNGTFVPAYVLNNIFSRIPLFGRLLGGGRHEGLFAVNYRISGPMSHPSLTFNPLSAIAPGFLRQIFGATPPSPTIRSQQP